MSTVAPEIEVFDVKKYHHDIPEIRKYMNLQPLGIETISRQASMNELWTTSIKEFRERVYQPFEQIEEWKIKRLSKLVDWAFETSPFYTKLYKNIGYEKGGIRSLNDFESLPMINKDHVLENFPYGMPSSKFDINKCRWMSSSGSSGKQVQIVLEQERANLDILFKYRMFEFMGGASLQPDRWIYNIHYVPWWHTSVLDKFPVFSVTQDCDPNAILEHVMLLRPQVVSCIGSYLEKLASLKTPLKQYGVNVVSTNSESTSPAERARWSSVFQVPVLDEFASEELDILAMECPLHSYHIVEDDAHMELANEDQFGLGEVVGTDLWNFAMPMIRYNQGDLAEWSKSKDDCPCGSKFRRLHSLHGRADQAFQSRIRGKIAPGSLLAACELHLCSEGSGISEFRVIQKELDQVVLLYVKERDYSEASVSAIQGFNRALEDLFGYSVTLGAEEVPVIQSEKSYKRRTLINRMDVL